MSNHSSIDIVERLDRMYFLLEEPITLEARNEIERLRKENHELRKLLDQTEDHYMNAMDEQKRELDEYQRQLLRVDL